MTRGAWLGSMIPPAPTRNSISARRDMGNDNGRGSAGDALHVVMLGYPEPAIAPVFRVSGKVTGVVEGFAGPEPSRTRTRSRMESAAMEVLVRPERRMASTWGWRP